MAAQHTWFLSRVKRNRWTSPRRRLKGEIAVPEKDEGCEMPRLHAWQAPSGQNYMISVQKIFHASAPSDSVNQKTQSKAEALGTVLVAVARDKTGKPSILGTVVKEADCEFWEETMRQQGAVEIQTHSLSAATCAATSPC